MQRGELWWAALAPPREAEPGYRRPVVVLQADSFNRSSIRTVIVAALSSNLHLANAPGNVFLSARQAGLSRDSVVNVSQLLTLDRVFLTERIGRVPPANMMQVDEGLLLVLGLRVGT